MKSYKEKNKLATFRNNPASELILQKSFPQGGTENGAAVPHNHRTLWDASNYYPGNKL